MNEYWSAPVMLGIFAILFSFFLKLISLKKEVADTKDKDIISIKGRIAGNAVYSYKDTILGNISIEKTINFTVLKRKDKNLYISRVKRDTLICPANFNLYNGDIIEVLGYKTQNVNLNERRTPICHIVPLYIQLEKKSKLRSVLNL